MAAWTTPLLLLFLLPGELMGYSNPAFYNLRKKLLENYDPALPPVKEHTTQMKIETFLIIFYFQGLDEVQQTMTCSGWIRLKWEDEHLKWDPTQYGGIKNLTLNIDEIWHPDFAIYNSWPIKDVDQMTMSYIGVYPEGRVWWTLSGTFRTICELDLTSDFQECNITMGSWDYDTEQLVFTTASGKQNQIIIWRNLNREWYLKRGRLVPSYVNIDGDQFPEVTAVLTIHRKPWISSLGSIPLALAMLTVCPFVFPPRNVMRPLPGLLALVAVLFFTLRAAGSTPGTSGHVARAVSKVNPPLELVLFAFLYSLVPSALSVYKGDLEMPRVLASLLRFYPCPGAGDWPHMGALLNHAGLVVFGVAVTVQMLVT